MLTSYSVCSERFFHVNDPDRHELSFAEVLGEGDRQLLGCLLAHLPLGVVPGLAAW